MGLHDVVGQAPRADPLKKLALAWIIECRMKNLQNSENWFWVLGFYAFVACVRYAHRALKLQRSPSSSSPQAADCPLYLFLPQEFLKPTPKQSKSLRGTMSSSISATGRRVVRNLAHRKINWYVKIIWCEQYRASKSPQREQIVAKQRWLCCIPWWRAPLFGVRVF